jgi:hypothetical protein
VEYETDDDSENEREYCFGSSLDSDYENSNYENSDYEETPKLCSFCGEGAGGNICEYCEEAMYHNLNISKRNIRYYSKFGTK